MKHFSHFRWFVLGAILFGFALVLAPQWAKPVWAADYTIDDFTSTTAKVTATPSGTNPNHASTSDGSVAGGYRTLWGEVTSGTGSLYVDSNVTAPGYYSSSIDSFTSGKSIIQYDGTTGYDSPPAQIGTTIDLTQSGTNDAIAIKIVSNDQTGVPLIVRFYSFSGSRLCSTLSFSPPEVDPPASITVYYPFSLFTACGGYSAASPSAVDAIEVETDSTATFSTDRSFDFIEATSAPTALDLASFSGRAQANKVNLKWETGSEMNTLGFNVWRKQGKAGWKQLNADTIAAKNPGNLSGNKYSFTDANRKAGKTYRYKLQVLSADGSSSWSRIVRVKMPN